MGCINVTTSNTPGEDELHSFEISDLLNASSGNTSIEESKDNTESYIQKETEDCTTDTLLSLIFGEDTDEDSYVITVFIQTPPTT